MAQGLRSKEHRAFIAVLRGTRAARGMTQQQLADKLGWERQTISRMETGERTCSIWEFAQICKALGEKPSKMMQRIENW